MLPQPIKLTILGAGNIAIGPAVIAALASHFGERHLNIVLWDADPERLDLIFRLGRIALEHESSLYGLEEEPILADAIHEAELMILCCDDNCVQKWAASGGSPAALSPELDVPTFRAIEYFGWPAPVSESDLTVMPHQVLRWINQDDAVGILIEPNRSSPLHRWLDEHL